jgi:uncharacterized membrane protein YuzA (DUF378 family)
MENNASLSRGSSTLLKAAMLLAIIGAINWGLIGFFNWNLVDAIFGGDPREMTSTASRVVYALVGLAGLLAIPTLRKLPTTQHHPEPNATYSTR